MTMVVFQVLPSSVFTGKDGPKRLDEYRDAAWKAVSL